jgi:hypothetical protein
LKCNDGGKTITIKDTKEYNARAQAEQNCTFEYQLRATKMRIDHNYVLWYINISNFLLTVLIPVGVLIYLNCKIYRALHHFLARRPSAMTANLKKSQARTQRASDVKKVCILFSIVVILVICHSLRVVLNVDEVIDLTRFKEQMEKGCNARKLWNEMVVRINQLLIIINSSANFFVYVCVDKGFQKVLQNGLFIGTDLQNNNFNNESSKSTRAGVTKDKKRTSNDMELLNVNGDNN